MKKIFSLLLVTSISLLFVKCSNDDSSPNNPEGPLFVNGTTYQIGTNATGNDYNSTIYSQSSNYKTRTFTILRGSSTTQENSESINLIINYPTSQTSINGTYDLSVDSMDAIAVNASHSNCALETFSNTYGGDYIFSSGTVNVVDNGNNNLKLTFNNVVLKNKDSPTDTKIITGYCQTTFSTL